jgi:hypothetical protein
MKRYVRRWDEMPSKVHLAVLLVGLIMLLAPFASASIGGTPSETGYDVMLFKGMAGRSVAPVAKTTLIEFDTADLADDLAYLAAVPASTFFLEDSGLVFSSPLLFWQPPMDSPSDEETALDAGVGVEYFMEDYVTASGGSLDTLMTVGLERGEAEGLASKWNSEELVFLDGGPGIKAAADIATASWEWAERAVLAVVDPLVEPIAEKTTGQTSGTLPSTAPRSGTFTGSIEPSFHVEQEHPFDVPDDYRFVETTLEWDIADPFPDLTQRGKELGLHLYSGEIMVALSTEWNAFSGSVDTARSFVYTPGNWKASVVFIPTMGFLPQDGPLTQTRIYEPASYTLTYDLYGGVDVPILDIPEPGTRNVAFNLTWDQTDRDLGLLLRGPSGQEIASALQRGAGGRQTLTAPELGGGVYTASVISLDQGAGEVDFEIEYEWEATMSDAEMDGLIAATEAAVLASELNAPLLYATRDGVPEETGEALDLLGTRDVVLVDLMGGESEVRSDLRSLRGSGQPSISVDVLDDLEEVVAKIVSLGKRGRDDRSDVVFTTLSPWSYWYTAKASENPQGEEWGARYIGPAAYAAANHACPVLVTESDPRLSAAAAWHTVYWTDHHRASPSVSAMYLTGTQIYDTLGSFGLDWDGMETIVTVAGQYDIGTPWDRALVGPAASGRIAGTPVDAAYWTARGVLYPHIIFANPAVDPSLDPTDGRRIVGSKSTRTLGALRVTQDAQDVAMDYPVAFTWACYIYKFNERAAEYWGTKYVAADGSIPGESPSDHPWDNGVMPDLDEDVFEMYSMQAGYGEAESAAYAETIENLNRGSIMWIETMHGGSGGGGVIGFWSSDKNVEDNPHRGYEEVAQGLRGATDDPDVLTIDKYTGLDTVPCTGPRTGIGLIPERHDGVVLAYLNQDPQTDYYYGTEIDPLLENIHSTGIYAGSCSISNTFLHLSLVRHGSSFQVIDPWLTSWYVQLGSEIFYRDVGYGGTTVGEAYEHAISLVGAEYVTQDWFWDHWENVVLFGDPDIEVFTPNAPLPRPVAVHDGYILGGHAVMVSQDHPMSIGGSAGWFMVQLVGGLMVVAETVRFLRRRGYIKTSLTGLIFRRKEADASAS